MKKLIGILLVCALLFTSCTSTAVYYHDVKPADGSDVIMTFESVDKIEYTDWTKTGLCIGLVAFCTDLVLALLMGPIESGETV